MSPPGAAIASGSGVGYIRGSMQDSSYAIGQAVFIRTDTPDYAEETIPFKTLEELVRICSTAYPDMTLDKIMIYSMVKAEPCAVMLNFMSSSKGQRPNLPSLEAAGE